ncbi:hypothetical protein VCCP1035_1681A, partial [Vibrio cholerae CP1035(8)]
MFVKQNRGTIENCLAANR